MSTDTTDRTEPVTRRPGELGPRELARWTWRQLTSMRTALILLLVLALAAIPGSVIPQQHVDAFKTSQWQDAHPTLTPVYEKLGLFDVYGSTWFAAIYILLMISLVGCIVPRTFVYARGIRAQPPAAPRNLARMPDHATYETAESVDEVLTRARALLKRKRYRVRAASDSAEGSDVAVSAERGYLREVGNLVFHLSVLIVLVGFATGSLLGYKGGVILVRGDTFGNVPTQYDELVPGTLFRSSQLDDFSFKIDSFGIEWLKDGPAKGTAREFDARISYTADGGPEKKYDLKVNHPLTIDNTSLFLIGHGYAPVVTVRDGDGNIAYTGPTPFLPQSQDFFSFGAIKVPDAQPQQIGLDGFLYPTFVNLDGNPINVTGEAKNPLLALNVWTGDLSMNSGSSQSVYVLDTAKAKKVLKADGKQLRIDLSLGETVTLPDGLGTVTFDRLETWNKIQISQTPGKKVALLGVVLALVGLLGSLFIRPRRVWVRAVAGPTGTLVTVAALDRSGGGDVSVVVAGLVTELESELPADAKEELT